jgi:hypothetical protein
MGTSPTTERIASLNPEINLVKYEQDLNPDGQVLSQRTQPAKLCPFRSSLGIFVLSEARNELPIDHADMSFVVHVNISVPYIELFLNEKNMDNEQ